LPPLPVFLLLAAIEPPEENTTRLEDLADNYAKFFEGHPENCEVPGDAAVGAKSA
jgi:hypothetical protein